jgi:hypothetical protein
MKNGDGGLKNLLKDLERTLVKNLIIMKILMKQPLMKSQIIMKIWMSFKNLSMMKKIMKRLKSIGISYESVRKKCN